MGKAKLSLTTRIGIMLVCCAGPGTSEFARGQAASESPELYGCLHQTPAGENSVRLLGLAEAKPGCAADERPIRINQSLLWRGEWRAATKYKVGDAVSYLGSSYIAIAPSKNSRPTKSNNWNLLAAKGEEGARGDSGPTGPVGAKGDQGAQGVVGEPGATGPVGPIGPRGPQGEKGAMGDAGPVGYAFVFGPIIYDNPLLPETSFTADRNLVCVLNAQLSIIGNSSALGVELGKWGIVKQAGSDPRQGSFDLPILANGRDVDATSSTTAMFTISAGKPTKFGVLIHPTPSGAGSSGRARISYVCGGSS